MIDDKIGLEILSNRFQAIVDEMAQALFRTAHTVFVKETQDYGAALVSRRGEVFAAPRRYGVLMMIGMPMDDAVKCIEADIQEGDIFISNDPEATRGMCTHLSDVFLWKPLPVSLLSAPVFAQHLDEFPVDKWGGPLVIEDAFLRAGLALPVEWRWIRSQSRRTFPEANLGIFGGTDSCFTRYYARSALDLALNPGHAAAWASIPHRVDVNPAVEQFLFTACAAYHRFAPDSPHRGLSMRYLFPTHVEAYNPEYARKVGYTHLLGDAKHHPEIMARLAARVRSEDPEFYARCQAITGSLAAKRT